MKVIHRFYLHSKAKQNRRVATSAFYLCFLLLIVSFLAYSYSQVWPLFFIPLFISVAAPFIDVPTGRNSGKLVYYSPLLLATALKGDQIELHGGTLFDYYYTLSIHNSEKKNRKMILYSYLEGLLNLVNSWDEKHDHIKLKANAYFIKPQTASRLGFEQTDTNNIQKLVMIINYLPIMMSYSISRRGLHFPNILSLKSYESTLGELRSHKARLITMLERLKK